MELVNGENGGWDGSKVGNMNKPFSEHIGGYRGLGTHHFP